MAKITKETRKREVVQHEEYQAVVLEMNEDEALFLRDVLARIGGRPEETRRKHQETLTAAFEKAGVRGGMAEDIEGSMLMLPVPRGNGLLYED